MNHRIVIPAWIAGPVKARSKSSHRDVKLWAYTSAHSGVCAAAQTIMALVSASLPE